MFEGPNGETNEEQMPIICPPNIIDRRLLMDPQEDGQCSQLCIVEALEERDKDTVLPENGETSTKQSLISTGSSPAICASYAKGSNPLAHEELKYLDPTGSTAHHQPSTSGCDLDRGWFASRVFRSS